MPDNVISFPGKQSAASDGLRVRSTANGEPAYVQLSKLILGLGRELDQFCEATRDAIAKNGMSNEERGILLACQISVIADIQDVERALQTLLENLKTNANR